MDQFEQAELEVFVFIPATCSCGSEIPRNQDCIVITMIKSSFLTTKASNLVTA